MTDSTAVNPLVLLFNLFCRMTKFKCKILTLTYDLQCSFSPVPEFESTTDKKLTLFWQTINCHHYLQTLLFPPLLFCCFRLHLFSISAPHVVYVDLEIHVYPKTSLIKSVAPLLLARWPVPAPRPSLTAIQSRKSVDCIAPLAG